MIISVCQCICKGIFFFCDGSEIGHKAAVHAGKVLAAAAIDILEDTSILDEARAEFEKRTKSGYVCPIPADAVPVIPD